MRDAFARTRRPKFFEEWKAALLLASEFIASLRASKLDGLAADGPRVDPMVLVERVASHSQTFLM